MADVNGVRFHLLTGRADWAPYLNQDQDLFWNEARGTLELQALPPRLSDREAASSPPLRLDQRRGAARDRFGQLYWIDEDRRGICFTSERTNDRTNGSDANALAWSVEALRGDCEMERRRGAFQPLATVETNLPTLCGLAITAHHFLVVGTLDPSGLLIFDLQAGGPPEWRLFHPELDFTPFDLAADDEGGLVVVDRPVPDPQNSTDLTVRPARLWRLDRDFRVTPLAFEPIPELTHAIAAIALSSEQTLVLDRDPDRDASRLHLLRCDEVIASTELSFEDFGIPEFHLRGHDVALLGSTLFLVDENGQQVFAFDLRIDVEAVRLQLEPRPTSFPLRSFSGKALVATPSEAASSKAASSEASQGDIFYDFGDRWLRLAEQPRQRFANDAQLDGLIFDGKEAAVVWHRLLLDACLPSGTALRMESRAAERRDLLAQEPWREEPELYLRGTGSEIPYHRPWSEAESGERTGTWELLFQAARGRFLELRLTWFGGGRATPRLRALRVYYPRFSYLDEYLPAIYREDPVSASFLNRYLANPEGTLTKIEGQVERAHTLFDVEGAPAEALDWLAGWLGALLDPDWDVPRRRLFLAHAEKLFRWRGTRKGLISLIRLAIDPCPDASLFTSLGQSDEDATSGVRIVEHFTRRQRPAIDFGAGSTSGAFTRLDPTARWLPEQGVNRLHQLYRDFLQRRGFQVTATLQFPPTLPREDRFADAPLPVGDLWRTFIEQEIGFTYAPANADDPRDQDLYRDFLARRYGSTRRLPISQNPFTRRKPTRFQDLRMPMEMPTSPRALDDWLRFVSQVLPIKTQAHRFTVLIPAVPGEDPSVREERRAKVIEIVQREKPAHTDFDVELYWALLRVGSARLGLDTQVGEGARFVGLALGRAALGETFLNAPLNPGQRMLLRCDRLDEEGRS